MGRASAGRLDEFTMHLMDHDRDGTPPSLSAGWLEAVERGEAETQLDRLLRFYTDKQRPEAIVNLAASVPGGPLQDRAYAATRVRSTVALSSLGTERPALAQKGALLVCLHRH